MLEKMLQQIKTGKTMFVIHQLDEKRQIACWYVENYKQLPTFLQTEKIKELFKQKKSAFFKEDTFFYMVECILMKTPLYIMGGGTVALPLVQMANMCDFDVYVFDDRKEFACKERFHWAKEVVCMPFAKLFSSYQFHQDAYFVLVTRGHLNDEICLKGVLDLPYAYVGMIGSKRKNTIIKNHLLSQGYSKEKIDSIHAPIGLKINSTTPSEIAVSILAQLIQERAALQPQESQIDVWKKITSDCIIATILDHQGSTPRGAGSKMLIFLDGHIEGTIGGGALEYTIQKQAKQLFESNETSMIVSFSLTNTDAAKEGMICGGSAKVLLEKASVLCN